MHDQIPKVATQTPDLALERQNQLRELFPEAWQEGELDFSKLRTLLGDLSDESAERYRFGWAGKRESLQLLQTPSRATLRPAPDESIDFDATQNLFIEGDNLEVLKLLYKPLFNRVKMIYIDPPYNTGNDFIYPDNFSDPLKNYLIQTGQKDPNGDLQTSNPDTAGRVHSRWLSMLYPRLTLARSLLRDDGVIFVSIDDNEIHHLRLLMNEVFGEANFVAIFIFVNEGNIDNQSRFKRNHEYVVAYARNESLISAPPVIDPNVSQGSKLFNAYIENTIVKNGPANPVSNIILPVGFPANFERGVIHPKENFWPKLNTQAEVANFQTQNPIEVSSGWSSKDIVEQFIASDFQPVIDTKGQETTFFITESGAIYTRKKRTELQSHVLTVLRGKGTVQSNSSMLSEMGINFSYPKPVELIRYLIQIACSKEDIILDFFAGSGTTAQAVLELNREDDGNRRFVLVQLPEKTDKSQFPNIAEIAKERLRRVVGRMKEQPLLDTRETPEDLGFKVWKLGESHFRQMQPTEQGDFEAYLEQLELMNDALLLPFEPRAVLYEVALREGFGLNCSLEPIPDLEGVSVWRVSDADKGQHFFATLDDSLALESLRPLKLSPDDLFICRGIALDDDTAANLALQCRLKMI